MMCASFKTFLTLNTMNVDAIMILCGMDGSSAARRKSHAMEFQECSGADAMTGDGDEMSGDTMKMIWISFTKQCVVEKMDGVRVKMKCDGMRKKCDGIKKNVAPVILSANSV